MKKKKGYILSLQKANTNRENQCCQQKACKLFYNLLRYVFSVAYLFAVYMCTKYHTVLS